MKKYYVIHAWNISQIENGRVINDEKYYGAKTCIFAWMKYLYALFNYDYVEFFKATRGAMRMMPIIDDNAVIN